MYESVDILEIPLNSTKDVNDLVKWFETKKVFEKKRPTIAFKKEDMPEIVVLSFFVLIGMALMLLELKGKWKVKSSESDNSFVNFKEKLLKSKSESSIEKLIENRYKINIIAGNPSTQLVEDPKLKYNMDNVFGLWKGKEKNLNNLRENQWGKRK